VFRARADQSGIQYNEHNPAFPPPPIALPPDSFAGAGGQTLGQDEMAAILDSGFDEHPPPPTFRPNAIPGSNSGYIASPLQRSAYTPPINDSYPNSQYHHQHQHQPPYQNGYQNGYSTIDPPKTPKMGLNQPHSGNSISSSVESRSGGNGHAKKRSGGAGQDRYGPLGPLADDDTGWGGGYGSSGGFKGRRI
jgi:chitin synthase